MARVHASPAPRADSFITDAVAYTVLDGMYSHVMSMERAAADDVGLVQLTVRRSALARLAHSPARRTVSMAITTRAGLPEPPHEREVRFCLEVLHGDGTDRADVIVMEMPLYHLPRAPGGEPVPLRCQRCDARRGSKRCTGCNLAWYCSGECQRAAWPSHRAECRELGALQRTIRSVP